MVTVVSVLVGSVMVRATIRHQAREEARACKDHEQNDRHDKPESQTNESGDDDIADDQENCRRDDAGTQVSSALVILCVASLSMISAAILCRRFCVIGAARCRMGDPALADLTVSIDPQNATTACVP